MLISAPEINGSILADCRCGPDTIASRIAPIQVTVVTDAIQVAVAAPYIDAAVAADNRRRVDVITTVICPGDVLIPRAIKQAAAGMARLTPFHPPV